MQLLFRLLAVLLVLTTGGVFQTLASVLGQEETCEEEDGTRECTDCTSQCGLCAHCPRLATPGAEMARLPELPPTRERALAVSSAPVVSAVFADIFQPPRA